MLSTTSFGFPPQLRLLNSVDINQAMKKPIIKLGNGQLFFLVSKTSNPNPRLGLAVSKRHLRRSVDRNYVKRSIRETFRIRQKALGPLDIMVLTRGGLSLENKSLFRQELDKLWEKLIKQQPSF